MEMEVEMRREEGKNEDQEWEKKGVKLRHELQLLQ